MDSKSRGYVDLLRSRRIHLCHSQMYTRTHTSICKALIPPPALPEPLLHQKKKKKKTAKQKAVIGQHTRSKSKNINQSEETESLFSVNRFSRFFFRLFLRLCSLEESGAAGKGKRSNLCSRRTPRGRSKAVSCPDCPGRCRMSWCQSQSRRRCPLAGTFPAIASGWL